MQFQRNFYRKVYPRSYSLFAIQQAGRLRYALWYTSEEGGNGLEAWQGKLLLFASVADAVEYCIREELELEDDVVGQIVNLDGVGDPKAWLYLWRFFADLAERMELEYEGDQPQNRPLYDLLLLGERLNEEQNVSVQTILLQGLSLYHRAAPEQDFVFAP